MSLFYSVILKYSTNLHRNSQLLLKPRPFSWGHWRQGHCRTRPESSCFYTQDSDNEGKRTVPSMISRDHYHQVLNRKCNPFSHYTRTMFVGFILKQNGRYTVDAWRCLDFRIFLVKGWGGGYTSEFILWWYFMIWWYYMYLMWGYAIDHSWVLLKCLKAKLPVIKQDIQGHVSVRSVTRFN